VTILSIIQNACLELGIPSPAVALTSNDIQINQLVALANRAGKELASMPVKDACWSTLQTQYLFKTNFLTGTATTTLGSNILTMASTAGIAVGFGVQGVNLPNACFVVAVSPTTVTLDPTQTATSTGTATYSFSQISYPMPSDYDHAINQTFWDRNYRWQMLGPLTPQEWQVLKSGIAPTGPRIRFRIEGNSFMVDPYPNSVTTLAFEYISNGWCASVGGTAQSSWMLDTDVGTLSEELMTQSLIWRWRAAKGLDYSNEYQMFINAAERAAARDGGGSRTLLTNRQQMSSPLMNSNQIPDSGYGVPSA
jgi:hypothetical protein